MRRALVVLAVALVVTQAALLYWMTQANVASVLLSPSASAHPSVLVGAAIFLTSRLSLLLVPGLLFAALPRPDSIGRAR